MRYLTFLAGAEGLEPSARGFGVDVGERTREQVGAAVSRFLPQVRRRVVLVWCCEKFPGGFLFAHTDIFYSIILHGKVFINPRSAITSRRLS